MSTFRQSTSTLPPSIVTPLNNDDDPASRVSIAASLNNDNDSARCVVLPRAREAVSPTMTIEYITAQEQISTLFLFHSKISSILPGWLRRLMRSLLFYLVSRFIANIRGSTEQPREQPGRDSRSTTTQTEVLPGRISASRISIAKPTTETKSLRSPMAEFTFRFPMLSSLSANNVPNVRPPPGATPQRPYHLSTVPASVVEKAQHSPDPSVSSYSNQVPFDLPYRLRSNLPRRLPSEESLDLLDTKSVVESAVNLAIHPLTTDSFYGGPLAAAPSPYRPATKDGKSRFFPDYIASERQPSPPKTAFRYPVPSDPRTYVPSLTPLTIDADSTHTSSRTPFSVFLAKETHTIERNVWEDGYRCRSRTSFPAFPWNPDHDSVKKSEPGFEDDVEDDLPFAKAASWVDEMTRVDGDEDQATEREYSESSSSTVKPRP